MQTSTATQAQLLRLRYAAPLWAYAAPAAVGLVSLLAGRASLFTLVLGAGLLAWAAALLVAAHVARRELRVDSQSLVVPGLLWGESRLPLESTLSVSLEPPEGPRRLRVLADRGSLVVWAACLQGGEGALRALAIAVVRGSKAVRARSRPSLSAPSGRAEITSEAGAAGRSGAS